MQLLLEIADPEPRTVEIEWPTVPKVGEWVTVDDDNPQGYSSYKVEQVKLPDDGGITIRVLLSPLELGDPRSVAMPDDFETPQGDVPASTGAPTCVLCDPARGCVLRPGCPALAVTAPTVTASALEALAKSLSEHSESAGDGDLEVAYADGVDWGMKKAATRVRQLIANLKADQ